MSKVHNFIKFSEINESFLTEEENDQLPAPAPEEGAGEETSTPAPEAEGEEGLEDETPTGEGIPEIVKIYTDSEEDLQELRDAGIDVDGEGAGEEGEEGAEPTEGGEGLEGDEEVGQDVLYIKVKTAEGDDVILKFTEENEENRQPVEGEENTFDTELVANHNDFEYRVVAEIKVNPQTGEEEELEVEPEAQIEEEPAGEGDENGDTETPIEPNEGEEEKPFEKLIMNFKQFVNESKK